MAAYSAVPGDEYKGEGVEGVEGGETLRQRRRNGLRQRLAGVTRAVGGAALALAVVKTGLWATGYEVALVPRGGQSGHSGLGPWQAMLMAPALRTTAPRANVWEGLTAEENAAVWAWLHAPAQGLNLTEAATAGINDNQVYWIDRVPVNKSDALAFVDGNGTRPAKYARVILYEGGRAEPVAQEYMVGPLPVGAATTMARLDYVYNGRLGGTVPYNARGVDAARRRALDRVLVPAMAEVEDVTRALFSGAAYYGQDDERTTVGMSYGNPLSLDGSEAHVNLVFHFPGPAMYLLPIDLYVLVDWTGTDTTLWRVTGFVTKGRLFADGAALRAAFEAGELEQAFAQRRDYDWALVKYQPRLGRRALEERAAPRNLEVGGKRYRVDAAERYVEYMGWSFYVAHSRALGVLLHDVRFRGERILYELSMQEAASQYGGGAPKAASTVYHDASFSMGTDMFPLVAGFDCPLGSTFWDVRFHEGNATVVHEQAICLFEQDPGHPLSRHRAAAEDETGAHGLGSLGVVRNAELTLRFIATVGNYDYLFNYAFGLDGAIAITVRASGYLMASPYYADQGRFGPRIQQATQGSLHDHVITFKADFDLVDSVNSLEQTTVVAVPERQPWFAQPLEQITLNTTTLPTETPLDWGVNQAHAYTVVSTHRRNAWGQRRGYRLLPGLSNMALTPRHSAWSRDNMGYAKTALAVTRQHDSEVWANSVHNANLPWAPQQDFSKFFDGESVDGEDLVVWFNLGMHHLTRAEDVPVTLFSEAVSSMVLAPANFFDRAQDGDLRNRWWEAGAEAVDGEEEEELVAYEGDVGAEAVGKIWRM